MQPVFNPFCFVVQVSKYPSLHAKRSHDVCLLLLPSPIVLLDIVSECAHVVMLLLLAGDVETNPGPANDSDVLAAIATLSAKVDAGHAEMMQMLTEVRRNQEQLEQKVSDITTRLSAVESVVESFDSSRHDENLPGIVSSVMNETVILNSRLDELEDRSRRDNLIFYGLVDSPAETWAQSECHVRESLTRILNLTFPDDSISRAHRLGTHVLGKTRPIIVKFGSSKLKDNILSQRSKFRGTGISVAEDFCRATRQCRKKLIEFGKNSGQQYTLRLNKLHINRKTYVYCPTTDQVCELHSGVAPVTNNNNRSSTGTSSAHAATS
ncbi:uncharacterized protein LOC119454968 [Dermacentor silvarum]|nr:uncharacterized protein LOC119454968 [Dermacentor silvarum]